MKPKIISLGYAIPEQTYNQEEAFQALGYPRHFWRIFRDAGIDFRHFWIPIEGSRKLSWQEQQDEYIRGAPILSEKAILACLDGRDPKEIGCLIYNSCTGFAPGPTIAHYLGQHLGFAPSTYYTNIIGQGCESGFPGLKRAYDFVVATGVPALVVNCELSSLTYFPEPDGKPDPENSYELLRSNAIFADAAASALVGFDNDWRHPVIIDSESNTDNNYIDDLGYIWRDGRLRVRLSKRVPQAAAIVIKAAVETLLARQNLNVSDIKWWVIHAAGITVLDNIGDALGIEDSLLELSRSTLMDFGNTSSTSVGITGKRLMSEPIVPGDYAAVLSVGPGMTGGMTLLRFGG